jgi:hypothetical protein
LILEFSELAQNYTTSWTEWLRRNSNTPALQTRAVSGFESERVVFNEPTRKNMEVTKALAALKPLYGKGNIEIVTREGVRVRGIVRSMKTTQALTTPSVKVERADGQLVKVPFSAIVEIIDHNPAA